MSIELARRIKTLEAKVAEMEKWKAVVDQLMENPPEPKPEQPVPGRGMCPKCGVKPNHFFHVKHCRGQQKEEQKNDRIGAASTP